MRRLISNEDLAVKSEVQNRLGTYTQISGLPEIKSYGLLKDYKSVTTTDDIILFDGAETYGDIGYGYYIKTETTEPHDRGVILHLQGIVYKRIFTGPVYLEWFSSNFNLALARAIKYSYIRLINSKVYVLTKKLRLHAYNSIFIDMNNATIKSTIDEDYGLFVDIKVNGIRIHINKGTIDALKPLFYFANQEKATRIDCTTLVNYTNAVSTSNGILAAGYSADIILKSIKSFTKPVIVNNIPTRDNQLVTNEYITNAPEPQNVIKTNSSANTNSTDITFATAPVLSYSTLTNNSLVSELHIDTELIDDIFNAIVDYIPRIAIDIPPKGWYISFNDRPETLWPGTKWISRAASYFNPEHTSQEFPAFVTDMSDVIAANDIPITTAVGIEVSYAEWEIGTGLKNAVIWHRVDEDPYASYLDSIKLHPDLPKGKVGQTISIHCSYHNDIKITKFIIHQQDGYTSTPSTVVSNTVNITFTKPGVYDAIAELTLSLASIPETKTIKKPITLLCVPSDIDIPSLGYDYYTYTNNTKLTQTAYLEFTGNLEPDWTSYSGDISGPDNLYALRSFYLMYTSTEREDGVPFTLDSSVSDIISYYVTNNLCNIFIAPLLATQIAYKQSDTNVYSSFGSRYALGSSLYECVPRSMIVEKSYSEVLRISSTVPNVQVNEAKRIREIPRSKLVRTVPITIKAGQTIKIFIQGFCKQFNSQYSEHAMLPYTEIDVPATYNTPGISYGKLKFNGKFPWIKNIKMKFV